MAQGWSFSGRPRSRAELADGGGQENRERYDGRREERKEPRLRSWGLAALAMLALTSCVTGRPPAVAVEQAADRKPSYVVGDPYEVAGNWFYPAENYGYDETGIAAVYPAGPAQKYTTNGEPYDPGVLAAAHRTLQLPSMARVTNLDTGRSIVVRVNDRGTAVPGRVIELTPRAAELLQFGAMSTARVRVTVLPDESRAVAAALLFVPSTATVTGVSVDGAPAPRSAPRLAVQREGAAVVQPAVQRSGFDIAAALPGSFTADGRFLPAPVATEAGPVAGAKPRSIYVQAGAFSVFESANRLQARLSSIAPARIESTRTGGAQTFHVRLGPLETVERADAVLARVTGSGVNGARIVVD